VLVPWTAIALASAKVRVTAWVRANGATPLLTVTYGKDALPAPGTFSTITAIRSGRETSDGWAEITTGPIDTSVWGVPIAQITLGMSQSDLRRNPSAELVVDALEVAPVAGDATPAAACTIPTIDQDCGPDAECLFGHCVPASASWGPTPSAAHRAAMVDRWASLAQHVHGARNSAVNAGAMLAARPALVAPTIGGRAFFARMLSLVNALRNHHTSFESPPNTGLLQPLAAGSSSSTLGACAGVGELDLLESPGEQRLGFVLYQVAKTSVVGAKLAVGDAITKIDGMDPTAWVRHVRTTWGPAVPADPGADASWAATSVAWMISHRASTIEVTHCASPTKCEGPDRTVTTIDVAGPAWKSLSGTGHTGSENDPNLMACSVRFQDALANPPAPQNGDAVASELQGGDTVAVEFDGTLADFATWEGQVVAAFASQPTKMLFDVRQGNGGYMQNAQVVAEELRSSSMPTNVGAIDFAATTWDRSDDPALLMSFVSKAKPSCETLGQEMGAQSSPCDVVLAEYFLGDYYQQASVESPGVTPFTPNGRGAKVAWLQSANVSANDYLAAYVEGRTNQRVFGTGPTSGSYGTISSIAPNLLGWHGGSVQVTDSLWGPSPEALAAQSFRSGVGVRPDVVVAEKMSDAMSGVDTMLAAARAWLEAP
jgi:hypothetical protein